MRRIVCVGVGFLTCVMLLPGAAGAQGTSAASISGTVKDTSGAVLPGVTVEASSPVLIEKVRSTVTDNQGAYRILELPPGAYTVTFTLPAFKTFKREGLDSYAAPTAEAAVRWLPRTYSTVDVVAQYAPSDSTGTGIFTVDKSVGARWEHYWKSYFLTRVLASYVKSDFQEVSRNDRISRVSFGAYFDIRSWLRLGAELSHENRNSTDGTFDFSRNVVLFTIGGTL